MIDPHTGLNAAKLARNSAHAEHVHNTATLHRAEKLHEAAASKVATLEAQLAEMNRERGEELAERLARDHKNAVSRLDPADEKAMAALASARMHLTITGNAVKTLLDRFHASAARDAEAQQAVRAAAEKVLEADDLALAARFVKDFDAALEIGKELQARVMVDELNTPINQRRRAISAEVTAALARIPARDPFTMTVPELRGVSSQPSNPWGSRVSQLIAEDEAA